MIEPGTATNMSVRSMFDAIMARKQVRELARGMDFNLAEQASVSLAAWSLLGQLGIGATCQGELAIDNVHSGSKKGMRVTCTTGKNANSNLADIKYKIQLIVDDFKIDSENANQIIVSFVKWKE